MEMLISKLLILSGKAKLSIASCRYDKIVALKPRKNGKIVWIECGLLNKMCNNVQSIHIYLEKSLKNQQLPAKLFILIYFFVCLFLEHQ